jgi:hypothetical protein
MSRAGARNVLFRFFRARVVTRRGTAVADSFGMNLRCLARAALLRVSARAPARIESALRPNADEGIALKEGR